MRVAAVSLFVVFVTVAACSACTASQPVFIDVPPSWPSRVDGADCASLRGRYRNAAFASTIDSRQQSPWLFGLLEKGGLISSSTVAGVQAESPIVLEPPSPAFRVILQPGGVPIVVASNATVTCAGDGSLELTFAGIGGGGEATIAANTRVVVNLYSGSGEALLARWTMHSRGWTFPGVPYDTSRVHWLWFESASNAASASQ